MTTCFELDNARVVLDLDAGCVYAYYYSGDEITGDVWLFNVGGTPSTDPWPQGGKPPFCNSSKYCIEHSFEEPILENDFQVHFDLTNQTAGIYFRGRFAGLVGANTRPGWSTLAKENSPAAKKFTSAFPAPN